MTNDVPEHIRAILEAPSELARLFAMDHLHLSDQDIEVIVQRMRQNRSAFELGLRTPVGARKTPAKTKKAAQAAEADLKDLGL